MSAVAGAGEGSDPIQVLFALYHNMNALDFTGPLEIFARALHNPQNEGKPWFRLLEQDVTENVVFCNFNCGSTADPNSHPESKAFDISFCAPEEHTIATQGASFRAHMSMRDAHKRLNEFDMLVVPGGAAEEILKNKSEPLDLIRAFADLQETDPTRERSIFSVDTGSLLLGSQGLLQGLAATTHPDHLIKLELICQESSQKGLDARTDVMEDERYVVNNGRFDLGENLDDNPYVYRKKGKATESAIRKGSIARKESMSRRESILRRAEMRLGGCRVVTAGGSTCSLDAALYLVSALVSHDSAKEVARVLQYDWRKGVVVDSIDV